MEAGTWLGRHEKEQATEIVNLPVDLLSAGPAPGPEMDLKMENELFESLLPEAI